MSGKWTLSFPLTRGIVKGKIKQKTAPLNFCDEKRGAVPRRGV